jgi:hypothetical protein
VAIEAVSEETRQGVDQVREDRGFNKTTLGLINAMTKIAERNAAMRAGKLFKPKYEYSKAGLAVHLRQCSSVLTPEERALDAAGNRVELAPKRVKIVTIKRQERIDTSRYQGEKLREIRAGKAKSGKFGVAGLRERDRRRARELGISYAQAAE